MMKKSIFRIPGSCILLIVLCCIQPVALYAQGDGPLYQSDVEASGYQAEELDEETILEIEEALEKARILVELDKIDSAVLLYYDILKKDPGNIDALEDMLKVFFKTNNWAMVIFTLERIIELKPDDAMLREVLLLVYRYYQMPERELPVELQLASINPQNTEYLTALAETLKEYGFYEESLDFYEQAYEIAPDDPDIVKKAAELFESRGHIDKAISYYEHLAELLPDEKRPRMKLAKIYLGDSQMLKALDIYEAALLDYPENISLQREVRRIYKDYAWMLFDRGRYYQSRENFEKAAEEPYAAPFADEYAEDVEQELGLKALYDFKWSDYRFNNQDITRIVHTAGGEFFSWRNISHPRLVARRLHIENPHHEFDVDEIEFATDLTFGMRIDSHLEFGYSSPKDTARADDAPIYQNTWHIILNPRAAVNAGLDVGVERTRLVDTVEAVERDIFKTEFSVAYSRYFFDKIWTVGAYKYASITGDNHSHFANFDLAYTLYDKQYADEDPDEVKIPLYAPEEQHLGIGTNLEYVSYDYTSNLYFTIEEEYYWFGRLEYVRSLFEHFKIGLYGSLGVALIKGEFIKDGTISLSYRWPFRLDTELAYTISDVYADEDGEQKITRDYGLHFNVLFYF